MRYPIIFKNLLWFCGVVSLLATTGCIVPVGERRAHRHHEHHDEVIVGPPTVVVHVPVLEVRPPEVIVH